jgi:hypothetical protein
MVARAVSGKSGTGILFLYSSSAAIGLGLEELWQLWIQKKIRSIFPSQLNKIHRSKAAP